MLIGPATARTGFHRSCRRMISMVMVSTTQPRRRTSPARSRRRCARPLTGNSLTDTFVHVEADDISQQHVEGVIVDGERDEDGQWLLDGEFTTDEELIRVSGFNCTTEIL